MALPVFSGYKNLDAETAAPLGDKNESLQDGTVCAPAKAHMEDIYRRRYTVYTSCVCVYVSIYKCIHVSMFA